MQWIVKNDSLTVVKSPEEPVSEADFPPMTLAPGEEEEMAGERRMRELIVVVLRIACRILSEKWEIRVTASEQGRRMDLALLENGRMVLEKTNFLGPNIPLEGVVGYTETWAERVLAPFIGLGSIPASAPQPRCVE